MESRSRETEAFGETCYGATLSTADSTWTDLELIPGYHDENSAANYLNSATTNFCGRLLLSAKFLDTDFSPTDHSNRTV
jgi:hypothetical protein